MTGMLPQGYGVPASAGGDPEGKGVWGSSEDLGSRRFPPAEAGTPYRIEGTPYRRLKSGIGGMGHRGFDGIQFIVSSETDFDGPLTRTHNPSAISGVRSPGFSRWRSGGTGRVGKFQGPWIWKVSAG